MNSDDALKIFKESLTNPTLVQDFQSTMKVARRATDEQSWSSRMLSNYVFNLKLISMPLSGKSADVSNVIPMIDEVLILLKAEQGEDDGKKACFIKRFGQGLGSSDL